MFTLAIGGIGPLEIALIGGILILLFGARKLPELARSMGSSITQFKKGLKEEVPELTDSKEEKSEKDSN